MTNLKEVDFQDLLRYRIALDGNDGAIVTVEAYGTRIDTSGVLDQNDIPTTSVVMLDDDTLMAATYHPLVAWAVVAE